MAILSSAFWSGSYASRGYALAWQPELVWLHAISDALIALAYFSIPLTLILLMRYRRDVSYASAFWAFALFIGACGVTHAMAVLTIWQPLYGLEGVIKAVTAIVSLATAALIWLLLPKVAHRPTIAELSNANAELERLVGERDAALAELRQEIGHRERAEAALLQSQKLEAVGQLTGGIAHDFNNLLQAIAGNLELIAKRPDDADKVVRWSANALDALERGRSLTSQLLAFSRRQKLSITSVPVRDLILGMRDLIERAVAPLSKFEAGLIEHGVVVETDPLQLELAILNLAFNARDAMPEGGTLRIEAERRESFAPPGLAQGDYVALSIADDGEGMPPEVLERAMEPFFTTKEPGQGTGMGLAMVFGVVSQSGGTVDIRSEPGKGTVVTLYLPVARSVPRRDREPDPGDPARVSLAGCRILLIDDDAQVRGALAETLATAGAEVVQAEGGAEGVALARDRRPDLIIVDFAMPGMSGSEVAGAIRAEHAGVPVLLITGFADAERLDSLAESKVSILKKPFESRELLAKAAELARRRG